MTKAKYSEEELQKLTEAVIKLCLEKEGSWVFINNDHGKENQQEVFNRVRNILKLTGIRYFIPQPIPDVGQIRSIDRDRNPYKIKVMTKGQLLLWQQKRRRSGTFSERNGWKEPEWINDHGEF